MTIRALFYLIVSLLFAPIALADPGAGAWAISGDDYVYEFTDGTHSTVRKFDNGPFTVCFDPDTTSTGSSTAQVIIKRVVAAETDNGSIPLNGLTLTGASGADCIYEVPDGKYWVDVTVSAGGDTATVTFTKP